MLLTMAPIAQNNPLGQFLNEVSCTMEVQAAELPYSIYWETQADGSWKYKLNTGGYASGWIQDDRSQLLFLRGACRAPLRYALICRSGQSISVNFLSQS